MVFRPFAVFLFSIFAVAATFGEEKSSGHPKGILPKDRVSTFSLVARDTEKGEIGIIVASKYLAVGSAVPWADARHGAVATQSFVNVDLGPNGIALMAQGKDAKAALEEVLSKDDGKDFRQLALVDWKSAPASFTGPKCMPWAGHKTGKDFAAQGNLLAGPKVIDDMAKAFEETQGSLARRMLEGLKAADAAGGDKRGKQSAAILIVKKKGGPNGFGDKWIDLRVDDHPEPVQELERILKLSRKLGQPVESRK